MQRRMASCDVWDVVKVPFPYTNRPVQQSRPALVIGRHNETGSPDLLWVLMITSASNRAWVGDIHISDLMTAGLPTASIVRTAKMATIDAAAATRIGSIAFLDRPKIRDQITGLFRPLMADASSSSGLPTGGS